jgi:hypothetical protein
MNKERSFFCRTKTNETSKAAEDTKNFDVEAWECLKKDQDSSKRREDNTDEERLKQDELKKLSSLYEMVEAPPQRNDDDYPKKDSFEFLDQFKQRMKNSFMKNPPPNTAKTDISNKLESLETEISTQLSIDEDEKVRSSLKDDDELREIVVEKNSTERNKENQLERDRENNVKKTYETPTNEKIENGLVRDGSKETVYVNRVTLSQLSARLSKSTPSKIRNSKERSTQKRKISDYFDSLSKRSNNV